MQINKLSLPKLIEEHLQLEKSFNELLVVNRRNLADSVALRRSNTQLVQTLATQRQLQSEMLVLAKNVALGSLVAGISHELSTPVGNCLMAASTIEHQLDKLRVKVVQGLTRTELANLVQSLLAGAEMMLRNLERVAKLMDDFKRIPSDSSNLRSCEFELHAAIDAIVATKSVRKQSHRIENQVPRSIKLNGYLNALGDVVSELIENSLRHGFRNRQGGTITVGAKPRIDFVELVVVDDGCGISPEHLERIFDPFFTTTLGQGSNGLGLHAVYNIVQATLRGKIYVSSVVKVGTRFTIHLPAIERHGLPEPCSEKEQAGTIGMEIG